MNIDVAKAGRPRSEQAKLAVLRAVDDLLVEVGYGALTMKGIAERAGVGRQTVYRWWSTKAEVLFEASGYDAEHELRVPITDDPVRDVQVYLTALERFLTRSDAGAAYRALLGEAQHDPQVAALIATKDVVADSALTVLRRALPPTARAAELDRAVALLVGPVVYAALAGRRTSHLRTASVVERVLSGSGSSHH